MFNSEYKKEAQERLRRAINKYEYADKSLKNAAASLYQTRVQHGIETIKVCENYINTLVNSPKEFDDVVVELKFQLKEITGKDWELINENPNTEFVAGSTAGAGVMAGAGVAVLGPTAAMAFATTFGTASTGMAISSLSGAAATNAALAWLGGGAVAAGGGGMAGGSTLLALVAGPVAWTVGGVALAGSGLWLNKENEKIGAEANKRAIEFEGWISKVNTAKQEVTLLEKTTIELADLIYSEIKYFEQNAPKDYRNFSDFLKERLAALINSIHALSQSLKKTVDLKL
ncbi:hypothetical protein A4S05_28640 [Nostoc sp. KVJ20]|uniref:hypothetical protein n=1 Tax=Nostoc sp. KVJ20 TaxID=457944 RepID=UPI00083CB161|nr:hypothetical protein [Nostoc sp. KVJ20]ODH01504.1 hypothetical protein A4S05_28640 [Nostoc sp. KVJ20]